MKNALLIVAIFLSLSSAAVLREDEKIYDQRQNGTENYRINIDGVLVAIAPAEDVLAAISNIDFDQLAEFTDLTDSSSVLQNHKGKPVQSLFNGNATSTGTKTKPEGAKGTAESKQSNERPGRRNRLRQRLANIIKPFLKRNQN